MRRLLVATCMVAMLACVATPGDAVAAVQDVPGMDTAANMKEWLKLTDDQVTRLVPPMPVALEKKLDVPQKLSDGSRITIREKLQAEKAIEAANDEVVKAMSAFLSPNPVAAYQAATKKK